MRLEPSTAVHGHNDKRYLVKTLINTTDKTRCMMDHLAVLAWTLSSVPGVTVIFNLAASDPFSLWNTGAMFS